MTIAKSTVEDVYAVEEFERHYLPSSFYSDANNRRRFINSYGYFQFIARNEQNKLVGSITMSLMVDKVFWQLLTGFLSEQQVEPVLDGTPFSNSEVDVYFSTFICPIPIIAGVLLRRTCVELSKFLSNDHLLLKNIGAIAATSFGKHFVERSGFSSFQATTDSSYVSYIMSRRDARRSTNLPNYLKMLFEAS